MQKIVRAVIVNLEFINITLTEKIVDEQYNLTTRVFLFYFIFISFWNEIKILETFWNVKMGKVTVTFFLYAIINTFTLLLLHKI